MTVHYYFNGARIRQAKFTAPSDNTDEAFP